MLGRCFRPVFASATVNCLINQGVFHCSSLTVVQNNELNSIKANQLEKQKIVDQLINSMKDDTLIYDKRLDADMDPFSENVDLEYLDDLKPPLENTFNLAHYVNRMPTLQRLVDLGVNLYVLEQDREIAQYLVRLDFEQDIKNHLFFLKNVGIEDDQLGTWITCNPLIFRQSMDNLKIRLDYLKSKGFNREMVERIIKRYPLFLNFSIKRIEGSCEYLQREYKLTDEDIRQIVSYHPKVVHFSNFRYKEIAFSLKDVMELSDDQARKVVVGSPTVFYKGRAKLEKVFDILHWQNGYSKDLITETPHCLTTNINTLLVRINYLKSLQLFQPDPTKPCFTALKFISQYGLRDFITECAQTSILDFNRYLKSL